MCKIFTKLSNNSHLIKYINQSSPSFELIIFELSFISGSDFKFIDPFPLHRILDHFTFIIISIFKHYLAFGFYFTHSFIPILKSKFICHPIIITMIAQQDQKNIQGLTSLIYDQPESIIQNYSHVTKHPYVTKIFCWIESGNTQKVISFFNTFPHLLNEFYSPNNWNPFMFAVRYGNMELIEYFKDKGMKVQVNGVLNSISIVHTAIYSDDISILRYVLKHMNFSPNPINGEISPLKLAMKAGRSKMVELLISRGAYYVFDDVFSNIQLKPAQGTEDNCKYMSLITNKQVHNTLVLEDNIIKDFPIKETLRYARVHQIAHMQKYARTLMEKGLSKDSKFYSMACILTDQNYYLEILKVCVNKGSSILKKNQTIQSS